MEFFVLSSEEVAVLNRVKARLYTEQRMDGDAMRDAAHDLRWVVEQLIPYPEGGKS